MSIDDREYDIFDKGKITWHIQYRRTNGIKLTKDFLSHNEGTNDYDSKTEDSLTHETIVLTDELEKRQMTQNQTSGRKKRESAMIINEYNNHDNMDSLKLAVSTGSTAENVFFNHHDPSVIRDRDRYRLRAKLSIQKDDVQTVLPIAKVCFSTTERCRKMRNNSLV